MQSWRSAVSLHACLVTWSLSLKQSTCLFWNFIKASSVCGYLVGCQWLCQSWPRPSTVVAGSWAGCCRRRNELFWIGTFKLKASSDSIWTLASKQALPYAVIGWARLYHWRWAGRTRPFGPHDHQWPNIVYPIWFHYNTLLVVETWKVTRLVLYTKIYILWYHKISRDFIYDVMDSRCFFLIRSLERFKS